MPEAYQTIRIVSRRTGLSPHVIRIWEKRYHAVAPERTGTNRRLYTDREVERLLLLRDATRAGHTIASVANLSGPKLRELAGETPEIAIASAAKAPATKLSVLDGCIEAVKKLDAKELTRLLSRGAVELGTQALLHNVIAPLAQKIGELWRNSELTAAHEHFASAIIRSFLGHSAKSFVGTVGAPELVVGTPSGQLHELGALIAGAAAANIGWNVTYLGPSLPAIEIAGIVWQKEARAVALSLVYPEDDAGMEGELKRLRQMLPANVPIFIGGRAAPAYARAIRIIYAVHTEDLQDFCRALDELRKPHARKKG